MTIFSRLQSTPTAEGRKRSPWLAATAFALALGLTTLSLPSEAQGRYRGPGPGFSHRPPPGMMHHHPGPRYHGGDWVGPVAALAIGGLIVGAIAANANTPPAPTYVTPPPPPPTAYGTAAYYANQPPPDNGWWHFCRSSGRYYPYVSQCPEGWLDVQPR